MDGSVRTKFVVIKNIYHYIIKKERKGMITSQQTKANKRANVNDSLNLD